MSISIPEADERIRFQVFQHSRAAICKFTFSCNFVVIELTNVLVYTMRAPNSKNRVVHVFQHYSWALFNANCAEAAMESETA